MGSRPPPPQLLTSNHTRLPTAYTRSQTYHMCNTQEAHINEQTSENTSSVTFSVINVGECWFLSFWRQKTTLQPVSVDPHTGKTRLPKLTIHKEAYPCPHCDRIFSSMSGRFYHMPVHTGQYTYRCPDCQQGFMELSKFKRHMIKNTTGNTQAHDASKNLK